jgi:DeoR family transcriptional regulator of aga operon
MASTSPAERRSYTLDQLEDQGHVSVNDLSDELDVSAVTIRKDLQFLAEKSLLIRTHGGAIPADQFAYDIPLEEKAQRRKEEKRRIGKTAAKMLDDRDTFILDSGTTTLQIVRSLNEPTELTLATNSIHVAREMVGTPDVTLILLGGTVRPNSASIVGPYAEKMLRDHSFSKLFLAGDGFDVDHGLTTTDEHEAHLNQLMIESAEKTIVVVDSSKFGRRGLCRICQTSAMDTIITDEEVPDEVASKLRDEGIQLIIA